MNSKQRRALRVFSHEVELNIRNDEQYYKFDKRMDEVKIWLRKTVNQQDFIVARSSYNSGLFKFRNAAMATMFALKWTK